MDNPKDLGCQVEIWIEDEKYVFDKSFVVYVPANNSSLSDIDAQYDKASFPYLQWHRAENYL
jgi:hypothetical protein